MEWGKCFLLPDRDADCEDCHDMACPINTGCATYDMLADGEEPSEDEEEKK